MRRVYVGNRASKCSGQREQPVQMPCGGKERDVFQEVRAGQLGPVKMAEFIFQSHAYGKRQSWDTELVSPTLQSELFAFHFVHSILL